MTNEKTAQTTKKQTNRHALKPAPERPPKYDCEKDYTADDIQAVVDYYNHAYSLDKLNYLQAAYDGEGRARVYITGKYAYGVAYGIKRYQVNLYENDNTDARSLKNYYRYKFLYAWLLSPDGESNVKDTLEFAEHHPKDCQAISNDRPPQGEPHTDWKYRYHYLLKGHRPPQQYGLGTAAPTDTAQAAEESTDD